MFWNYTHPTSELFVSFMLFLYIYLCIYIYLWALLLVGEEEKGVDSDEGVGNVADPGAPGVSPSGQPKKMVRTTRKRQRTLANKPQDFQVCIPLAKHPIWEAGEL